MVVLVDSSEHFAPILNYLHKWAEPMPGPFLHCLTPLFKRQRKIFVSLLNPPDYEESTSNTRRSALNYIIITLLSSSSQICFAF